MGNVFSRQPILSGSLFQYRVKRFVGEGVFGTVAHCTKVGTKEHVALKILKRTKHGEHELKMLSEIKSLDPDKHNVVRFIEAFNHENHVCLVFEKLDVTLSDFIEMNRKLDAKDIRPIAQQMLVTLDALKQINVIHTDIKPANVMLVNHRQQPLKIKLIDFGAAVLALENNTGNNMQALIYRSPEVMLGLPVTAAIDMWSLGCLLAFLYTGRHLYFGAQREYDVMRLIVHLQGQPRSTLLGAGIKTHTFFKHDRHKWKLKERSECGSGTALDVLKGLSIQSLNDLTRYHPKPKSESEGNDTLAFLSLLKQMLHPDYDRRTIPSEALQHAFIREVPEHDAAAELRKSATVTGSTKLVSSVIVHLTDDCGEGPSGIQ